MSSIQGPSHDEIEAELAAFEGLFRAAVQRVMEQVAAELGHVRVAATEPQPGEPAVSMDTLALIATLWVTQVQGLPEGGGEENGNGVLGAALRAVYYRAVNAIRRSIARAVPALKPHLPELPRGIPGHPSQQAPSPSVEVDVPRLPDGDAHDLDSILVLPEDIAENYLSLARNRMVRFSDELWDVSREQLLEGFAEGESIEELRDRLVNVVGLTEKRATVVARTEIISATNAGSLAMVQYSDFTGVKIWLATEDLRTRPTHMLAEGQSVGLEEAFTVGGSSLQFPGDPSGSPEEIINCRCTLLYSLDDDPNIVTASGHQEFCRNPLHPGPCAKPGSRAHIRRHGKSAHMDAPTEKVSSKHSGYVAKNPRSINSESEAAKWGKENFTPTEELSSDELDSLKYYAGDNDGYRKINGVLRGTDTNPDTVRQAQPDIKFMDQVMARNKVPEDITVSRAMSLDGFSGDPSSFVGKVFQDKAYLSTSLGDTPGGVLSGQDVHMLITVPKGTPAYSMQDISKFPEERELLLGRETNLAITEATYDEKEGRWLVKAAVIL